MHGGAVCPLLPSGKDGEKEGGGGGLWRTAAVGRADRQSTERGGYPNPPKHLILCYNITGGEHTPKLQL